MIKENQEVIAKDLVFLTTRRSNVKVTGKLTYNNGDKMYTNLRLKKEILQTFPPLKDNNYNFIYVMQQFTTWEELEKEIKSLKKQLPVAPFLFHIAKESK